MTEQTPSADGVLAISAALMTAWQHLAPEHQALAKEEKETTARERQGTLRRMRENLQDANNQMVFVLDHLATVHGMRALGLHGQHSQDRSGNDYSPLLPVGDPDEKLCEAATILGVAIGNLDKAYVPTQKYPALARCRCPQSMRQLFAGLRDAVTAMCAELMTRDLADGAPELEPWKGFLDELEARVCPILTLPDQAAWPLSKHVAVAPELRGKLLSAGCGSAEREVALWLMFQPDDRQQPPGEIAAQLDLEPSQVEEALEKLKAVGLLRDDGTLLGVHRGSVPA
ncbi:hypothetical protein OG306_40535 (plasmid) [Streptomyces sp. NBC_01241]|uniref:hypothetical protein n=1 Tax=Streptomyces sp. NBC_01241 TaxID=2903794 RepID=UPI002F914B43|nr:hypothetical protein OG306_40535 [Streptomyces sp. NBC_01241]